MRVEAFKSWMEPRYTENSARSRYSCAKRVEDAYGDLDGHYDTDKLAGVLSTLTYSLGDGKLGKPNPTKLKIDGNPYNPLNNFKTGVRSYREFRDGNGEFEVTNNIAVEMASEILKDRRDGRQFEVERHLQEEIRREIGQLEPGLSVVDGGVERSVNSGFIDILAQDQAGALVVIELKSGTAKREAIGQIVGYMGDLISEEAGAQIRGILVAADFDKSCQSGVRAIPTLKLKRYRFSFTFEAVD